MVNKTPILICSWQTSCTRFPSNENKLISAIPWLINTSSRRSLHVNDIWWQMTDEWLEWYARFTPLTHWGQDKKAAILQTIFSNAFSWTNTCELRWICHWCLFLKVPWTTSQHKFKLWLGTEQATGHYLNQWWLVSGRIHAHTASMTSVANKLPAIFTSMHIRHGYHFLSASCYFLPFFCYTNLL